MNILFLGDIMPGGVLPYQDRYIDDDLLSYMRSFNLRVGTLECGVGTNIPFDEVKYADDMSNIFVRNEDLFRLKEMNINVVTLANNHAFDLGLQGFENAAKQLKALGILYCGAGHNVEEARKPAVICMQGKSFAFIGCMLEPPCVRMYHIASEENYGVYQVSIEVLESYIVEVKKQYDYVFVLPHWGEEHSYYPPTLCKEYAYRMIDAGADAVIGSHPHIANPVMKYKGKFIYFSLGNFLFPDKCMQVPRPMYYPNTSEECHSLDRVWTYPSRINRPVIAVWKGKNRIGMVVEYNISRRGTIKTKIGLTSLNEKNILCNYHSWLFKLRFIVLGYLMKLPRYGYIRGLLLSRYNIVGKKIDYFNAFNIPVEANQYKD